MAEGVVALDVERMQRLIAEMGATRDRLRRADGRAHDLLALAGDGGPAVLSALSPLTAVAAWCDVQAADIARRLHLLAREAGSDFGHPLPLDGRFTIASVEAPDLSLAGAYDARITARRLRPWLVPGATTPEWTELRPLMDEIAAAGGDLRYAVALFEGLGGVMASRLPALIADVHLAGVDLAGVAEPSRDPRVDDLTTDLRVVSTALATASRAPTGLGGLSEQFLRHYAEPPAAIGRSGGPPADGTSSPQLDPDELAQLEQKLTAAGYGTELTQQLVASKPAGVILDASGKFLAVVGVPLTVATGIEHGFTSDEFATSGMGTVVGLAASFTTGPASIVLIGLSLILFLDSLKGTDLRPARDPRRHADGDHPHGTYSSGGSRPWTDQSGAPVPQS